MVSVTLLLAAAHAGPCGILVQADQVSIAVKHLQPYHLYVNFEGSYALPGVAFRLAPTDGPEEAVASLLAVCGAPCSGYQAVSVDGRVDLRSTGGPPHILDALVEIPPGERSLVDLAKELGDTLAVSAPADAPLTAYGSLAYRGRRVSVPPFPGPVPARDLLAATVVLPSRVYRPNEPPRQERVGWIARHGVEPGQPQGFGLTVVDVTPNPEERDWEPPDTSREDLLDVMENMYRHHPPPGLDPADAAARLQRIEAKRQAARELDARAAVECDP